MALARRLDRAIELFYIYLTPAHRGKGLARLLLDELFHQFNGNADEMFLEVRASNLTAQNSYKSYGFTEIARRLRYYPDGEDAIIMQMASRERYDSSN